MSCRSVLNPKVLPYPRGQSYYSIRKTSGIIAPYQSSRVLSCVTCFSLSFSNQLPPDLNPNSTMSPHPQTTTHSHSLGDPETFWSHHAARLHWHHKPSRALTRKTKFLASGTKHEHWSWFADGEISTTYNCVDRHVLAGHGDNVAIVWESPVTGVTEKYTYARLLDEVEVLAGVLREEGVQKGDVVIIYSMQTNNFVIVQVGNH